MRPAPTPRTLAPTLALAALATTRAASGSPQDLFAYGPRPFAMGGTGAAFVTDVSSVHANPAGLSGLRERTFTLGLAGAAFALEQGGQHFAADSLAGTIIGVGLPLPFGGALRDRIGVGVGFFTPTNIIVRGRILRPETPQFVLLPDRVQSVTLQFGMGVRLPAGFSVGVGVMALAGLTGTVLVTTDATGRAGSAIDTQLTATYAPVAGVRFQRGRWRAAAVYRGALEASFGVSITATGLGVEIPTLDISGVAQYDPAQVHLEGAWETTLWTLSLGLTGKAWGAWEGPARATTPNSPAPPSPDLRHTLVPRVGVERRWTWDDGSALALRGGAFFEPSPAPLATPARQYLDNHRLAVSAGLSMSVTAAGTRYTAELFAQVHHLFSRTAPSTTGAPTSYGGNAALVGTTATVSF